jgi:hypothetical protein
MATIYHESRFIGNARTPRRYTLGVIPMGRQSSAYGYSQALDGTWDEYLSEVGARRRSRDNIDDATDFMGWYMDKTDASPRDSQDRRAQPVPCLSRGPRGLCARQLPRQGLASAGGGPGPDARGDV